MVTEPLAPAALLLAAVLIWSGVGKLRSANPDAAFDSLNVPARLSTPLIRRGFPWVEIALGCLLLITGGVFQILVAAGSVALFTTYLVLIARALRARRAVSCNCFGESNTVISRWTLVRNVALLLTAVTALLRAILTPSSTFGTLARLGVTAWVGLAVTALLVATTALLVRAETGGTPVPAAETRIVDGPGQADVAASGKAVGEDDYLRQPIPSVAVESMNGEYQLLSSLSSAAAQMLLFVSPTCPPCIPVLAQVPAWIPQLAPVQITLVVGDRPMAEAMALEFAERLQIDHAYAAMYSFGLAGTPSAVLLGADGLLAGGPVVGDGDVTDFVQQIIAQLHAAASADATNANS